MTFPFENNFINWKGGRGTQFFLETLGFIFLQIKAKAKILTYFDTIQLIFNPLLTHLNLFSFIHILYIRIKDYEIRIIRCRYRLIKT